MKIIILGLEGLNYEIIEACKEEMPTLYKHLKESSWGRLKTTWPYYTGPAWTSIQTGKKISNHGMANFFKYDSDLNIRLATGNDLKEKTFYELADQNNYKCLVMNLPYTYPPKTEGDTIFSWLHIHDKVEDLCHPTSLIHDYPSLNNYKNRGDRTSSVTKYLETGEEMLISQGRSLKEIFLAKKHDLYFFLLNAADLIQHKVFSELIKGETNKDVVISKRILKHLDSIVKWVDENKEEKDIVLITSDHGFKDYQGKFFINTWLKNNGYLFTSPNGKQIKDSVNMTTKKKIKDVNISWLVSFVKKHPALFKLSEKWYGRIVNNLPFNFVKQPGIDLEKTKAYARSIFEGIIFFNKNLSQEEKASLKKEIMEKLSGIDGIDVHDSDVIFNGKYREELGEIAVIPDKFEVDVTITDNEFLHVKHPMHSLEGIFMAYGKGIKKKHQIENGHICDLTPTVLHILGIPIPTDIDGKVSLSIFEDNTLLQREVKYSEVNKTKQEKDLLGKAIKSLKI